MKLKKRLLYLAFLLGGQLANAVAVAWMLALIVFAPDSPRALRISVAWDQLGNATTGGSEDETISSRADRLRAQNVRWACVLCRVLDWLEKDHCKNSRGY